MDALMSLVIGAIFILAIGFTRDAGENPYENLYEYQLLNDVFEVFERSGASIDIGEWVDGDESAGGRVGEKLGEIARYSGRCIEFEVENKKMSAGCGERMNAGDLIVGSRILALKNGYEKLEIRMR